MFVNKFFTYLAHNSKSKSCFNVKSSTSYFHMNAKILAYFQICIRVPLISTQTFSEISKSALVHLYD